MGFAGHAAGEEPGDAQVGDRCRVALVGVVAGDVEVVEVEQAVAVPRAAGHGTYARGVLHDDGSGSQPVFQAVQAEGGRAGAAPWGARRGGRGGDEDGAFVVE